ncbi:MAG: type II toxin-antitoxin system RelE/ParE family toxin [Deltaproteobacteria bacterium]|nr:type II toxin-antitoxin system RelE/ParE family toxin [Deltaproteobacteria bacterium]
MTYNLKWHEKAIYDLRDLDRKTQKKIIDRIKEYLPKDPVGLGKPLKGMFKGLYRYRYGSHRIIYAIDQREEVVMILRIGDRKDVYDNKAI